MINGTIQTGLPELRERLAHLLNARPPVGSPRLYDAVISHIEVNDRHGVGVVLGMLFRDRKGVLAIRSRNLFDGDNRIGDRDLCIDHNPPDRLRAFSRVAEAMTGMWPRRMLCMPYFEADVWNGLIMKYLYGVPLCMYIMDDQSLNTDGIPTPLMAEALRAADLRLAISQEMAHGYEEKYGQKFWLVPPVVAPEYIPASPPRPDETFLRSRTGVLIGNVWGERWLRLLRQTVREAGVTLHWFGDDKAYGFPDVKELAADGIIHQGFRPQKEFVELLRRYPYAVMATSPLGGDGSGESAGALAIARLSLPSRLPFLLATTNAPIVVLGSGETTAARFVKRFDIGPICGYDSQAFRSAVAQVVEPSRQATTRARLGRLAPGFSAGPVVDWIWRSLELGRPADDRYEQLMPRLADEQSGV